MKLGTTCPIQKQNGTLLNGSHPHHLEAKNLLQCIGVKERSCWKFFLTVRTFSIMSSSLTVNKEMYADILSRLRDAVRRKCPHSGEPTVDFSITTMLQHTDRFFFKDFLIKNDVTTLEHLPILS
jgi:hypothetical protein